MKRYLVIVVLAIAILNIPQAMSYTTPDRIITAYKAPSVPLIDAVEDSIWIDAIAYAVLEYAMSKEAINGLNSN